MIFLIATQNKHKKVEFERILAPLGIEIKTAGELGLQYPDVEETGTTFEENALLKARAGCLLAGVPTLTPPAGAGTERPTATTRRTTTSSCVSSTSPASRTSSAPPTTWRPSQQCSPTAVNS